MDIKAIILHCSATFPGQKVNADIIRQWHLQRGFNDIGYHFVITPEGEIQKGRPLNIPGAHTLGWNHCSIGICYVGGLNENGLPADTRTPNQRKALTGLIRSLVKEYPDIRHIYGHRDFAAKACPCFDAKSEYEHLINK